MERRGYILLDRNIRDWPHWDRKPFSPGHAWIDLLLRAAWKPHKVEFGGRTVHLKRGQLVTSQRILAAAWGWSPKRVRLAVKRWTEMDAVRVAIGNQSDKRSNRAGTLLTIVNYDDYQRPPKHNGTSGDPEEEPVENQSGTGEEPGEKEGNEGEARWSPSHDYVSDWNAIAERRGWVKVKAITPQRIPHLKARESESLWDWPAVVAELEHPSGFLDGWQGWSFDWLIKNADNFVKVLEGKYRDRTTPLTAEQFVEQDVVQ